MGNQTGPRERGPNDQTNRTAQPTADQPTQSPTVTQTDRPAQDQPDRQYVCLDCQFVVTEFPTECPHCGGAAFQTAATSEPPLTFREQFMGVLARATAPLNPYIPR